MRVGVADRWRCRGVCTGMIGIGSIVLASLDTPGMLLRVTRRCRRGVARKSRLAVGFLVSRMGGASVIRGNVMMGEASITLCSSSRAACCSANLTLCSSKIGGGSRIESMRVPRSLRSRRPFGVTPAMAAFSVNSSVSARKC